MTSVSIIIPTYNEKENIEELCERIFASCSGLDVEVVFVDDGSPDGTGELAEELAKRFEVSVVRRAGKSGLSSAVIEGFERASGDVLGVMDADLSHPPEILPGLIDRIKGGCDVCFGSRNIRGGGVEGWPLWRKLTSGFASLLAKPVSPSTDPMSGLFFLRRDVIDGVALDPIGFKIGLEILVKGGYKRYCEVPYVFRDRARGESKLNAKEYVNYVRHLVKLYSYKIKSFLP